MANTVDLAKMTLSEHLDELRSRLVKSISAILLGTLFAWSRYEDIFAVLREPFDRIHKDHPETILALTGVTSGLVMQLNVALVAGVLSSSPIWIFQIWRFVAPGLHKNEKKWSLFFTAVALPMFLTGCWLGYFALPGTLSALFSFTPAAVTNVTNVENYISFSLHLTLFFGLGFLLPLMMVVLNFFHIVSGKTFLSGWRWIVLGAFFFGAIATPNGDPLGMAILALPVGVLCFGATGIAILVDRRRATSGKDD